MNIKRLLKFLLEESNPKLDRAFNLYNNIGWAKNQIDERNQIDDNDRITIVKGNEVEDENEEHIGINTSRTYTQPSSNPNKPNGIWYAFGFKWFETIINNDMDRELFLGRSPEIYRIKNINGANIKFLNRDNIAAFQNKYGNNQNRIDWQKVADDFDGIELKFDPESLSATYRWLSGWDIQSGCIWRNASNIGLERIVSDRVLQAEKERTDQIRQTQKINFELEAWWRNQVVNTKNHPEAVNQINQLYSNYFPTGTNLRNNSLYENFIQKIRELLGDNDPYALNENERVFKTKFATEVVRKSILQTLRDLDTNEYPFRSWADRLTREGIYAWEDKQRRAGLWPV